MWINWNSDVTVQWCQRRDTQNVTWESLEEKKTSIGKARVVVHPLGVWYNSILIVF